MFPARFELAILAIERPQILALDRSATGIGWRLQNSHFIARLYYLWLKISFTVFKFVTSVVIAVQIFIA
jgi:hypothetical protein